MAEVSRKSDASTSIPICPPASPVRRDELRFAPQHNNFPLDNISIIS